ncbi:EH signature domain-containing protein [Roseateles koreensis]|uniref:EH signature domain-containing protein n=1 Tax=Roseateles koreensis TaxID=2987526 RepID=A0ABT5KL28_9BURK|nr:EH signature domain-containing protein [Roseateles koreensis]MDC8783618.1 EH signature domain-containing protein [Roseateles koreensis]
MSNSRSLGALKLALGEAMDPQLVFHAPVWGDPQAMSRALREIRKDLAGSGETKPNADVMQAALTRFYETQTFASFTELKYVCYGVTVPIGKHKVRLIDRRPLFGQVLSAVEKREGQVKQFRRCYQGLLSAYFGFSDSGEDDDSGSANWRRLRGFLGTKLDGVRKGARQRGEPPPWLDLLGEHRNLLGEDPCAPYAGALANGDTSGLRAVCEGLGIPSSSWVWDDALMAYVRLVCSGSDPAYKRGLPGVLDLVNDRIELRLPQRLATKATALTVSRYSKCEDRTEHGGLRDTALAKVGNPWLARSAWDAEVNDEAARQMVEGWLKRRLIKDFFELLAQDGGADVRRLDYWLKWEPKISDMWFILGADARRNPSPEFKGLRSRMAGRARVLTDPNGLNNAFVMRIGPLLVIEFGATGNACYIFAASDFKTDLDEPQFTLTQLKQRVDETRISHSGPWEGKLDAELSRLLRSTPASRGHLRVRPAPVEPRPETAWPAAQQIAQTAQRRAESLDSLDDASAEGAGTKLSVFDAMQIIAHCRTVGLKYEDRRDKGGSFWVLMHDPSEFRSFASRLVAHGFRHAEGKGYWLRGER